jgi:hypothetical protein
MHQTSKSTAHKSWVAGSWTLAMTEKVRHMSVAQSYWFQHRGNPAGQAAYAAVDAALHFGGTTQTLVAFGYQPDVQKFLALYGAAVAAITAAKKVGAHKL